eukprot:Rhum_TRINITY_DN14277_c21_g1::Rhum_TRINITY_DN14277_c21_g1_i1::g.77900::m.77900
MGGGGGGRMESEVVSTLQVLDELLRQLVPVRAAAKVLHADLAGPDHTHHGSLDALRRLRLTNVLQHQHRRADHRRGVRVARAREGGGGAVRRLEDGVVVADVAGRREAESADHLRGEVGEDVAEHVLGHDDVVLLRSTQHEHALRVDVRLLQGDARVVSGDAARRLDHESARLAQDVRLVDNGDRLPAVLLRVLEGTADDVLAALAGHDARAHRDVVEAELAELAHLRVGLVEHVEDLLRERVELDAAVHALRVLTVHDPVDVVAVVPRVARDRLAGTEVRVQVELLPHAHDRRCVLDALLLQLRAQLLLRLERRLRRDRREQGDVRLLRRQDVQGALREGVALGLPELPADVRVRVLRLHARRVQHLDAVLHHLRADAVTGEESDAVGLRGVPHGAAQDTAAAQHCGGGVWVCGAMLNEVQIL